MNVLATLKKYPGILDGEDLRDRDLEFILEIAKDVILKRRHPFGTIPDTLPDRFKMLQVRIAVDIIQKLGAEGHLRYSEGEISREFAAGYVSPELLREVMPLAGIPTSENDTE